MSKRALYIIKSGDLPIAGKVHTESTEPFSGFNQYSSINYLEQGTLWLRNEFVSHKVNQGEYYFLGKYANFRTEREVGDTGMFLLNSVICPESIGNQAIGTYCNLSASPQLHQLFKQTELHFQEERPFSQEELIEINLLTKQIMANVPENSENDHLLKFLYDHIGANITIDNLAKAYGKSTTAFTNLFTKAMGTSPHKWIKEQRLHFVLLQMQHTQQPVSKLYMDWGFEDLAHFSKSFKQYFGYNPSDLYGKVTTKIIE